MAPTLRVEDDDIVPLVVMRLILLRYRFIWRRPKYGDKQEQQHRYPQGGKQNQQAQANIALAAVRYVGAVPRRLHPCAYAEAARPNKRLGLEARAAFADSKDVLFAVVSWNTA